jgi:Cu/Ag efflux pump CusA
MNRGSFHQRAPNLLSLFVIFCILISISLLYVMQKSVQAKEVLLKNGDINAFVE